MVGSVYCDSYIYKRSGGGWIWHNVGRLQRSAVQHVIDIWYCGIGAGICGSGYIVELQTKVHEVYKKIALSWTRSLLWPSPG